MTQNTIPTIQPGDANFDGERLVQLLNELGPAINSGQSGAAAPPWAQPGFIFAHIAQDGTIEPVMVTAPGQVVRVPRADKALAEMDPQAVRATLGVALRPERIYATGGNETDLAVNTYQARLVAQFLAVGPYSEALASCNIAHANQTPCDMMAVLRLQGITTPGYVRDTPQIMSTAASQFGGAAVLARALAVDDLVPGQTYEWQWRLRKGQAFGPSTPRGMQIVGKTC